MVYVSHHAGELRRIATSVVRLDAGRVVAVGGKELLAEADADASLYIVSRCSLPPASSA